MTLCLDIPEEGDGDLDDGLHDVDGDGEGGGGPGGLLLHHPPHGKTRRRSECIFSVITNSRQINARHDTTHPSHIQQSIKIYWIQLHFIKVI